MPKFVKYNDEIFRVLIEEEKRPLSSQAWIIPYFSPAAPQKVLLTGEKYEEVTIPEDFYIEEDPSPKRLRAMKKRLALLKPLIDNQNCIVDTGLRKRKIADITRTFSISEKTVLRYYFAYLAKGERGLLPLSKSRASNLDDDTRLVELNMRKAIGDYYYSPKKYSLKMTYEMFLMEYWKDEDGRLAPNPPRFSKFLQVYKGMQSEYRKIVSRYGMSEYQRNYRPLLGKSENKSDVCGTFEIDATEADVHIVSKYSRKPIGRPIVYLAVDVATRLVTGVYIGLSGGAEAAMLCVRSMMEDKAELCSRYGVSISHEQWPSMGLPRTISTDRGTEFSGGRFAELCGLFGIEIQKLPPYRPDLKGCVEKAFDCIQRRYKPLLRGYGAIDLENTREGIRPVASQAYLDINEFTKIFIECVVYYNSCEVHPGLQTPETISNDIPPIPCRVWEWKERQNRCDLVKVNSENAMVMLLPRGTGAITRQGLIFNSLRYDTDVRDETERYVCAGINGRERVTVAYDVSDTRQVYLLENGKYIPFELTSASEEYGALTFEEVALLWKEKKKIQKDCEQIQNEGAVKCAEQIKMVLRNSLGSGEQNQKTNKASRKMERGREQQRDGLISKNRKE